MKEKSKAGVVIPIVKYIAYIAYHSLLGGDAARHAARLARDRAGSSKYSPHQGKRECARRRG